MGGYQMGEVFVLMNKFENQLMYQKLQNQVKGIVFDSAIDVNEISIGLAKASTPNIVLQNIITLTMNEYLLSKINLTMYTDFIKVIRVND